MKNIFLKTSVFTIALAFLSVAHVSTVDAKRLGGGGNAGRSSSAPMQKQAQPAAQQKPAQAQQPAAALVAAGVLCLRDLWAGLHRVLSGMAEPVGLHHGHPRL